MATPLLDTRNLTLLRAAMGPDETAREAFLQWRAKSNLDDDVDYVTYRVLPLLVATAQKFSLVDESTARPLGIAKHIWLSNMLSMRLLTEAWDVLNAAGIPVMLLKGAALFARNDEIAAQRIAEDYDFLVPLDAIQKAHAVLAGAGFETKVIRLDRFTADDYRTIHAVHVVKAGFKGNIDMHWRPLPWLDDQRYVAEMFDRAETKPLANRTVRVPDLADHLFLAVTRPEATDQQEIVTRAIESVHILSLAGGDLDWERFGALVRRYDMAPMASAMLQLVAGELGANVPQSVTTRLSGEGSRSSVASRAPSSLRSVLLRVAPWRIPLRPEEHRTPIADLGRLEINLRLRLGWRHFASRAGTPDAPAYPFGFSFPEDEGRWTDGDFAAIAIPITDASQGRATVEIEALPFVPPGRTHLRFRTFAGLGMEEHKAAFSDGIYRMRLPARVTRHGTAVVVLQLDGHSPMALGLNTDPRHLGLFVKNASVVSETAAPRSPS